MDNISKINRANKNVNSKNLRNKNSDSIDNIANSQNIAVFLMATISLTLAWPFFLNFSKF